LIMGKDIILTSSCKCQLAWNVFNQHLEKWCVSVDGLPARKKELFDLLYQEDCENPQLKQVQERLTDHFEVDQKIDGNTFASKTYHITYKFREEVKDYNPKLVEEQNNKTVIATYVRREIKNLRGFTPEVMTRLTDILSNFGYTIYVNYDKIGKESDQLYKRI
jgi:hypothetical protein